MLIALVSAKGSPGVTTTGVALVAAASIGDALLVEADPAGGDLECWCGPLGEPGLLAVATEKRHPLFPNVPTFKELGFDMVGGAWRGIAVPSSTPENLRQQWSKMIGEINADPGFRKKMEDGGFALADISYSRMKEFMAKRKAEYIDAAKKAGILK